MKRSAIFYLGVVLCTNNAIASCDWATNTPPDDGKYKYFVARVYSQNSMSDAQIKAEQEINNQICRLFGAETVTTNEYYSDTTIATGTSRTNERCVGVRLEQFTKDKTDTEYSGDEYVACVRYKYAIQAYKTESTRIAKATTGSISFNETVGNTSCVGAPVKITTNPSGTNIYIDGEPFGKAPLKINNLCRGKHKLKITHDNYEPIEETLIVPLADGGITKTLKRATKTVKISASDPRAIIKVNGRNIGKTPVKYTEKLGETITIEASADGTEPAIRTIVIDKYLEKDSINLDLKPNLVKLDFSGWKQQHPNWDVYVDGTKIDKQTKIEPNENHNLKFTKDGFRTIRDTYSHEPTNKVVFFDKTYNMVQTKSMSRTNGLNLDLLSGVGANYMFATLNNGSNSSVGVDFDILALRMRLKSFYTRIGINYDISSVSEGDFELSTGFNTDLNLGVNLGDSVSLFGIVGYGQYDIKRPKINNKDFSGSTWDWHRGLGIEYNLQSLPAAIRLTYTTSNIDLWNEFYVGSKNTDVHKIRLSFNVNWSGLIRMMQ